MPRQIARLKPMSGASLNVDAGSTISSRVRSRDSVAPHVNASQTYAASSSIGASSRNLVCPRGAVGAEHAGAIEVDVARRRPRDAADRCGQHVDDVEQRRQPVRQVGRANQQGARALAVALVHQPELALAQRDRAPRCGPHRPSRRHVACRERPEQVVLAVRRDQAVEAARRGRAHRPTPAAASGVGAGVTATAGGMAREQAEPPGRRRAMPTARRIV